MEIFPSKSKVTGEKTLGWLPKIVKTNRTESGSESGLDGVRSLKSHF